MNEWKILNENNNYEINKKGYSTGSICDVCKGKRESYKESLWEYV